MVKNEELNRCFDKLMMVCGEVDEKGKMGIAEWKDIPMELLLRIVSVVDDHRTIIMASEVCSGWREAIYLGLTHLCLSCELQLLNLGWCENVGDIGVMSLAYGCPKLRTLDLCGCVFITDDSVIALANRCPHLTSLGLYYCRNITDRAIYSLVHSRVKNKNPALWETVKSKKDEGLKSLNISQCTALTPPAVQALCDSFPALHTCSGRHSLVMSGCLNLTSVHCACAVQAHRSLSYVPHHHAH
ncbi:F-box protein SKP2A [Linum perenne]